MEKIEVISPTNTKKPRDYLEGICEFFATEIREFSY
jgi:hypothetical protein